MGRFFGAIYRGAASEARSMSGLIGPDRRSVMILIAPTGWAGAGYRRRSSEARFDHLLIKPASLEAPAAAIGRGTVEAR